MAMPGKLQPIVELVNLSRRFEQRGQSVKAVDGVSLAVREGESSADIQVGTFSGSVRLEKR